MGAIFFWSWPGEVWGVELLVLKSQPPFASTRVPNHSGLQRLEFGTRFRQGSKRVFAGIQKGSKSQLAIGIAIWNPFQTGFQNGIRWHSKGFQITLRLREKAFLEPSPEDVPIPPLPLLGAPDYTVPFSRLRNPMTGSPETKRLR